MAFCGKFNNAFRPTVPRRYNSRRNVSTSSTDGTVLSSSSAAPGNALSTFSLVGGAATALGTGAIGLVAFTWNAASVHGKVLIEVRVIKEKLTVQEDGQKQATRHTEVNLEKVELKFDKLEAKQDAKLDRLETKVDRLETKVDRLETKVDRLETKVERLETKFDRLEAKFDRLTVFSVLTAASTNAILYFKCKK